MLRRAARHRRVVTALLAGAAAWCAVVAVVAAATPPTAPVLVVARDLPAGAVLSDGDVEGAAWPRALVPAAAVDRGEAVGASLTGAVAAGEPLTSAALSAGAGAGADRAGRVRALAGLADRWAASLVTVGSIVDVHLPRVTGHALEGWEAGIGDPVDPVAPLARGAVVVHVLGTERDTDPGLLPGPAEAPGGAALVLSVTPAEAARLAGVAGQGLAVTIPGSPGG
jgi:hypothetical protein